MHFRFPQLDAVFSKSRDFFTLPIERKLAVARPAGSGIHSGYIKLGQEKYVSRLN